MNLNAGLVAQPMQEQGSGTSQDRRRRLWFIVVAHLLIVGTFFVASFLSGDLA